MKKILLKRICLTLLPVLLFVFSPGNIMFCKMGMTRCVRCCPQMPAPPSSGTPQVAGLKVCCGLVAKDQAATLVSAKPFGKFFPDGLDLAALSTAHAADRLGDYRGNLLPSHREMDVAQVPLFLMKASLLI